jgi:uncharacterized ion transporter superfamily protein YfcC
MLKKTLPSPITILMVVIILAAACTWLIPAGKYDTLKYDSETFTLASAKGDSVIPASQGLLDKYGIKIPFDKFKSGSIKKAVSIPGSYHEHL